MPVLWSETWRSARPAASPIETLAVETEGNLDLRGFLGIDPAVAAGYEELRSVVRIKGSGTREQFAEIRRGRRDFAELLQHFPAHRAQTNIDL